MLKVQVPQKHWRQWHSPAVQYTTDANLLAHLGWANNQGEDHLCLCQGWTGKIYISRNTDLKVEDTFMYNPADWKLRLPHMSAGRYKQAMVLVRR
jgi:hypothetical protein